MKRGDSIKRFIIEFGLGIDLHGQDVTKAASKAVKDAISKSCLIGLAEIVEIKDPKEDILIKVTVAVSKPELVDKDIVAEHLPVGTVTVTPVTGGLTVPGLYFPALGDKDDSMEAAIAVVEVWVKTAK